jgi:hypothetical protein
VNERMGAFVTGRRTFGIANGWGGQPPARCPDLRRHPLGAGGVGLRRVSLHLCHGRRREGRRAGEGGRGGNGRRRGRSEHRPAVHKEGPGCSTRYTPTWRPSCSEGASGCSGTRPRRR